MPDLDPAALAQLRRRGDELFRTPYNELPVTVAAGLEDHQPQVIRNLADDTEIDPNLAFRGFDRAHAGTALQLADRFWALTTDAPDEAGLAAVLDAAESELATQNSDLVKYALAVFITNNPVGRNLYIPPLIAQSPGPGSPSHPGMSPATAALGGPGDEAKLDYFREDPDFNGHHAQSHRVYPSPEYRMLPAIACSRTGRASSSGTCISRCSRATTPATTTVAPAAARSDRPRPLPADAFDDYSALVDGYQVEPIVGTLFRGRAPNRCISTIAFSLPGGVLDTSDLDAHRELLLDAARTGRFQMNGEVVPLTPDAAEANLLGCTLEANLGSVLSPTTSGRTTACTTSATTIGRYQLVFPNGDEFPISHINHAEFAYFFRLENDSDLDQQITVRVFLAAAAHADDRRWWIEMDKFLQPLGGGERLVVYRPARLSSVVRKPARRPVDPVPVRRIPTTTTAAAAGPTTCCCRGDATRRAACPSAFSWSSPMRWRIWPRRRRAVARCRSAGRGTAPTRTQLRNAGSGSQRGSSGGLPCPADTPDHKRSPHRYGRFKIKLR
jgi:hypothetical protein